MLWCRLAGVREVMDAIFIVAVAVRRRSSAVEIFAFDIEKAAARALPRIEINVQGF